LGARLLPAAMESVSVEDRRRLYERISKLLVAPDILVERRILPLLALFPDRNGQNIKLISSSISRFTAHPSTERSKKVLGAIEDTLLALGRNESTKAFDDFMLNALSAGRKVDQILSWFSDGPKGLSERLMRALGTVEPSDAEQIVRFLLAGKGLDRRRLKDLTEAAARPDIAPIIERQILIRSYSLGRDLAETLSKAPEKVFLSAMVLQRALGILPADRADHLTTLVTSLRCLELSMRGQLAAHLMQDPAVSAPIRSKLLQRAIACAAEPESSNRVGLAEVVVAGDGLSSDEVVELLISADLAPEFAGALLKAAERTGISSVRASRLVMSLLENPNQAVRERTLESPLVSVADDPAVSEAVVRLYSELPAESRFRSSHLIGLARIGAPEVDWSDVVRRAARETTRDVPGRITIEALRTVSPVVLLPDIIALMDSAAQDDRLGAVRLAGLLGSGMVEALPRLRQFVEGNEPLLRYSAIISILQIDRAAPDLQEPLRRLLVNRYFDTAERSGLSWSATAAVAGLDRGAFGILREGRLNALLFRNSS